MGHFCQYNDSLYFAVKMAENIVDQEQVDDSAMESSMEKQLNDSAARYLEQSDSIVREMTELRDQLAEQQAVEQEDPFFIPFLIAGAAKAIAVAAKAALAAKAVIAAKAAKAAKWGRKAWKVANKSRYIRNAARYGRKAARY